MGFLKNFFEWLGGLFTSMKKLYNKLTDAEQKMSVFASGFFAVVNANLEASPEVLFKLLQLKFPDITKDKLHLYVNDLTNKMRIADSYAANSLEANLKLLQNHLSKYSGNGWKAETLNGVNILISLLLPGTPLEKITMLLEFIYRKLVKGKI